MFHWSSASGSAKASANDNSMPALEFNVVMGQESHNALRCGAAISGLAHCHATESQAGDSVYIFLQRDHVKAGSLIDLGGHRVLQQNAMHVRVCV